MELFGIRFEAYKDPTENIADFSSCVPEASSRRTTYDPEGIKDACSWKLIRKSAGRYTAGGEGDDAATGPGGNTIT
eukprot:gene5002-6092_t